MLLILDVIRTKQSALLDKLSRRRCQRDRNWTSFSLSSELDFSGATMTSSPGTSRKQRGISQGYYGAATIADVTWLIQPGRRGWRRLGPQKQIESLRSHVFDECEVWFGSFCVFLCISSSNSLITREFKKAAELFLETLSTFTSYELFSYNTFIYYTVLMSSVALERVDIRKKVLSFLV